MVYGRARLKRIYSHVSCAIIALVGWMIFALLYFTATEIFGEFAIDEYFRMCMPVQIEHKMLYLYALFGLLLSLYLVIVTLHMCIYHFMARMQNERRRRGNENLRQRRKFHKAMKSVRTICILYGCCILPPALLVFADSHRILSPIVHHVIFVFTMLMAALDPMVYVKRAPEFRAAFKALWLCESPDNNLAHMLGHYHPDQDEETHGFRMIGAMTPSITPGATIEDVQAMRQRLSNLPADEVEDTMPFATEEHYRYILHRASFFRAYLMLNYKFLE